MYLNGQVIHLLLGNENMLGRILFDYDENISEL